MESFKEREDNEGAVEDINAIIQKAKGDIEINLREVFRLASAVAERPGFGFEDDQTETLNKARAAIEDALAHALESGEYAGEQAKRSAQQQNLI